MIVTTFRVAAWAAALLVAVCPQADSTIIPRGAFDNSRIGFEREGRGRVAFIGGSITQMNGYRPMVASWLQERFPKTEFDFVNAGISSTCSTTGAFRLGTDVFGRGPVDLLFVEFAVNDDQDAGHARRECIRGMEGILRQARRLNPMIDLVVVYFVNPDMLEMLRKGREPLPMAAHEEVLKHYGVSTIHLAREVAQRIDAGTLTWKEFGGTHPKPPGNAICAEMISKLLSAKWKNPLPPDARRRAHPVPGKPLDANSYFDGRFVSPAKAGPAEGWTWHVPDWKAIPGGLRKDFQGLKLLCADQPGRETTLKFEGRAVGAYVLAGPDAGIAEASLDGGPFRNVDLYHPYSRGLHYPRTVMFEADLEPGPHTLRLRVGAEKNPKSRGHAIRILQFAVNQRREK